MDKITSWLKSMFGGGDISSPGSTMVGSSPSAGSSVPFASPALSAGGMTFHPAPQIPAAAPVTTKKASGTAPSSATPPSTTPAAPAAGSSSSAAPATAPAYIPFTGYGAPAGLTQTKTPQGGTAWQDAQGNVYIQDAGGFKLVTSLPGQNPSTMTYSTPAGPVSPAYAAAAAAGTSGQSASDITATSSPSSQPGANVSVGPTAPVVSSGTGLSSFSAGTVPSSFDLGSITSSLASVESGLSDGSMDAATAADTIAKLQSAINDEISSLTAAPSTPGGTTYNVAPSTVSGGDPTVESAIASDPATFNALNEQFGVPQLQTQYINALTGVNSINAAVTKLTDEINNNTDIPQWLAVRQVAYLANKASELTGPLTNQANTIKAQLSYATSNMKLYYTQQNTQARLALTSNAQMQSQFKTALANGGVNAADPNSIASWSSITGFPQSEVYAMASNANLTKALTISGKQATQAANNMMLEAANDPTYIAGMARALASGALTIQDLPYATGRGAIGSALTSKIMMAAQSMVDASGNPNGVNFSAIQGQYSYATNPAVQTRAGALKTVQNMSANLQSLSDEATRSNYPTINSAISSLGIEFGGTTYNNFKQFAQVAQNELSGVIGYGSATDQSRQISQLFADPNQSPQQFISSWNSVVVPALNATGQAISALAGSYGSTILGINSDGTLTTSPSGASSSSDPAGLGL